MPRIKSAIKRVEVTDRNRIRNRAWKSAVRTQWNNVEESLKAKTGQGTQEALKVAYSVIDKAVSKGILHKNTAARKKSAIARLHALGVPTKKRAKSK